MIKITEAMVEAAWQAFGDCPIDMCGDHDEEQKKCVVAAVEAALSAAQAQAQPISYGVWINGKLSGCAKSYRGSFPVYAAPVHPTAVPGETEEWKLVPIEPTPEMVSAGRDVEPLHSTSADIYKTMIAASPRANTAEDRVRDLEERLAKAAEALEPFMERAKRFDEIPGVYLCHDNVELWQDGNWRCDLTVGDLRRARTALSQIRSEK